MSLGKISKCYFGFGGYDDAMIGFTFVLDTVDGSCVDFWGYWAARSDSAKWSEEDREKMLGSYVIEVKNLLRDSKKKDLNDLVGCPIEVQWNGQQLSSWRILKEVI